MHDTAATGTPALLNGCVSVTLKLEVCPDVGKARRGRLVLDGGFFFDAATYRMACPQSWRERLWKLTSYSFEYGLAEGRFVLGLRNLALDKRRLATLLPVDQAVEVTQTISTAHERARESQFGHTAEMTAAAASTGKLSLVYSKKSAGKANDGHQTVLKHSEVMVKVYAGGTAEAPSWRFATAASFDTGRAILAGHWQGKLAEFNIGNRGLEVAVDGRFYARQQDIVVTRVYDDINCADLSGGKRAAIQAAFLKHVRERLVGNDPLIKAEASYAHR